MPFEQDPHRLEVETPLDGNSKLFLTDFQGKEEISRPFLLHLRMISEDPSIQASAIVGKSVTVKVKYPDDGEPRYFNGIVSRFAYQGTGDRFSVYRAEVVPTLWMLTRTADCRIFQDKDIPAILEDVFGQFGVTYQFAPTKSYPTREYCVQYRETAFNFVSRLMEQYGIFYFFKHEDGQHTLVLGDAVSAYFDCKENDVAFDRKERGNLGLITSWEHEFEYRPGKWTHTDYNFETPTTDLKSDQKTVVGLPGNEQWEMFDYPGEYSKKSEGDDLVRARMEEDEVPHEVASGGSLCRSFTPGGKFTLSAHTSPGEAGKQYVITSVSHRASGPQYVSGGSAADIYSNTFTCVPDKVVLRPTRMTPKPVVQGSQTAVVVGPSGEEIYPDKYGRVKVQFFWDRVGQKDDKSSCWIRCMVPSAGRNWGFMSIPRVGQEVVVSYLEGDPDRPLISGQVYNADQMPAYTLPDEMTKTYVKTNSSKGGDGHNELRFEDKQGKEQVYIHAEKDMDCRVKNDSREIILGNRHQIVGSDDQPTDERELISQDKHLNVKRHQIDHTEGNYKLTVGKGSASDGGKLDIVVEKKECHSVGSGGLHLKVDGDVNEKVGGSLSENIGMNVQQQVGQAYAMQAGQTVYINGGMSVVIEGGMQLSLVVGGSYVSITPVGVDIFGPLVNINSGGSPGSGNPPQTTDPDEAEDAQPTKPDEAGDSKTGTKSCG